jgi:prevent-host-death family protein
MLTWLDLAMKRVKIAELKDHLSEHLRAVEQGDEIEVTDRNRPIARITSIEAGPHIVPATRSLATLRRRPRRPGRWAVTSLELLLEERGER